MPTPDLTAYNDLTLYDVQPSDLVARALLDAATKLPEWQPVDGNTELVLMEALSLVVSEMVYAINRVPSAVTVTLLNLFGITRSQGTPATATITFTLSDNLGHEIPAGTLARLTVGADTLDLATDAALSVAPGATTGTVAATATVNTNLANGVVAGTVLELISAVAVVDSVQLATDVAAGSDPETDSEWLTRAVQQFARLNDTLNNPAHFTAAALTHPQVARATTIDNYNAGAAPGHVSVAVLGYGGALLSGADKTSIQTELDAQAQANLAVHVIDPTITNVTVDVTVHADAGSVSADVQAAVTAALEAYLSTDQWPWDGVVRRNALIGAVSAVPGVAYLSTLTTPAADVNLPGAAPLARAGAVTVTVT